MSDFIRLNGYDVKDIVAREYIDELRKLLGYTVESGKGVIQRLERLETKVEENASDISGELDDIRDRIDSIAHSHGNKSILDAITQDIFRQWTNKSDFSGSFNDLTDIPYIFSGKFEDLTGTPKLAITEAWEDIKNKPEFHIIATSGDYNDLKNKPSGMASEDFVNGAIPTKISYFENDVPYFCEEHFVETETINELVDLFIFMAPEDDLGDKNESNDGRYDDDNAYENDNTIYDEEVEDGTIEGAE